MQYASRTYTLRGANQGCSSTVAMPSRKQFIDFFITCYKASAQHLVNVNKLTSRQGATLCDDGTVIENFLPRATSNVVVEVSSCFRYSITIHSLHQSFHHSLLALKFSPSISPFHPCIASQVRLRTHKTPYMWFNRQYPFVGCMPGALVAHPPRASPTEILVVVFDRY